MFANVSTSHEVLIERLQKGAFEYFLKNVNFENGLVADTSRANAPSSIAVTGLGITSYIVAAERGWVSRTTAAQHALNVLTFFWQSVSGESETGVTGHKGFYYHFLDMTTGVRVWQCELSMIDTALLMVGILSAGTYFTSDNIDERAIRDLSSKLFERVDWNWATNGADTLSQGWKPDCGFFRYGWDGYNEGTILYLLGLSSRSYPLTSKSYDAWSKTYQWENIYGHDVLYAGPLFIHQFSHIWVDFRGIQDKFMREKDSDYFENSRRALYIQQEYARLNPLGFDGYSGCAWGLSAGEGPVGSTFDEEGRKRDCFGYTARGVPYGPDDGTLAPSALAASLPFAPEIILPTLANIIETYPGVVQLGALSTGVNPSLRDDKGNPWISEGSFGLDQGATLLMIENYRSGFIWDLMHRCRPMAEGLRRAGFRGGWLA